MNKAIVVGVLLFSGSSLIAQFGIGVKYQSIGTSEYSEYLESLGGQFSDQLIGASLYYWFRLENRRVEFLPEVGYLTTINNSDDPYVTGLQKVIVSFNTDIYLFDLEGDCDCPTFSKQGGYFKRSFFFEVTPGIDYQLFRLNESGSADQQETQLTYRIGLGVGFDFGISDLVTITPTAGMNWSSRPDWYNVLPESSGGEWIFSAGLRAIFRPDYKRRYR